MRALVLALTLAFTLPAASALAGPWHHFHLNLGKRMVHRLRYATHHHHGRYHHRHR